MASQAKTTFVADFILQLQANIMTMMMMMAIPHLMNVLPLLTRLK
jgi:hypothetical protein